MTEVLANHSLMFPVTNTSTAPTYYHFATRSHVLLGVVLIPQAENTNYSTLNSIPSTISFHPQLQTSHTRRNHALYSQLCKSRFSRQSQRILPCFPGRGEAKRGRLEPPQALGGKTPAEQSNAITLCFSHFKTIPVQ